jgi:hypothetical protein
MLNFEEALQIAKSKKTKINHCLEYEDAYAFEFANGEYSVGGDSPVVILKDSGEAINMISYAVGAKRTIIRDFEVE